MISNFNSGTTVTFPLYVFGVSLRGIPVQVNALATLLFLVAVIAAGAGDVAAAPRRADGGGPARGRSSETRNRLKAGPGESRRSNSGRLRRDLPRLPLSANVESDQPRDGS